jgi:hypothetical protein
MAVAVNATLVPLGQAEPPLQVQVVLHRREVIPAANRPVRKLPIKVARCS